MISAALPLCFAGCHAAEEPAARAQTDVRSEPAGPFVLGVQTHFGQDWPAGRLGIARQLGAPLLRDGLSWAAAEKRPGQIAFAATKITPLDRACTLGMKLMLTIVPVHPLYDGGRLVRSGPAVEAFARYLDRIADRFGTCLVGIEVGNELNGVRSLGPAAEVPAAYVSLMKSLYAPFKARHPGVALVGGSTNAIGTGYLDRLFRLGLLDHADGIGVHPYRNHGENVDWEIGRLDAAMRRHGRVLPIWASEFSDIFEQPGDAAAALVKMTTLLSGSGVKMASWYALADQKWFPTMGLVTAGGEDKPAARAFSFVQRELLPQGRPVSVSDDRLAAVWRFGKDRWVVWGAPRVIEAQPGSRIYDATGRRVGNEVAVGTAPLVVVGPRPALGETAVLADSLLQFGAAPWSYSAGAGRSRGKALSPLDSDFATSMGERTLRPLRIDDSSGAATPAADVTVRYTALRDMRAALLGCFSRGSDAASVVGVSVTGPGGEVGRADLVRAAAIRTGELSLRKGDTLDVRFSAAAGKRGHTFRYRIRLFRPGTAPATCPADVAGWS